MAADDVRAVITAQSAADAAAERRKLRRVLGRHDTIFFLISAMVVVDTIGAIAVGGGETFTWVITAATAQHLAARTRSRRTPRSTARG
jgi:hypothetical protein